MSMERLSLVAPSLAARIKAIEDPRTLRSLAHAAASFAISRAAVNDDNVARALEELQAGRLPKRSRPPLESLIEYLDSESWDLQDAVDAGHASQAEYLAAFARARAVAAVLAALQSDPVMAALESIYEAHSALANGSEVIDAVERTLSDG